MVIRELKIQQRKNSRICITDGYYV